jgi:hypothetical protein
LAIKLDAARKIQASNSRMIEDDIDDNLEEAAGIIWLING